jgi:hypothetical protein
VTLNIDTTKALRAPQKLRDLVQAILDSPPSTQETNWIEWKNVADVSPVKWRAELSRHVLGFANRDPFVASAWMGGCAYIVVGAAPGDLGGTVLHDVSSLEDWIGAYVGRAPKAPDWAPSYVTIADEKRVLIVSIEAPSDGDPIWTFHKEYAGEDRLAAERPKPLRAGSIFVRRKGKTETADPDEVEMLTRQACATGKRIGGLSLVLKPNSRAVAIDASETVTSAWANAERAALRPAPPPPPVEPTGANVKGSTLGEALENLSKVSSSHLAAMFAETRTADEFQAEVDAHVEKGIKRMPLVMITGAIDQGLGRIELSLQNETKRNLHQVEVELTFDADRVMAFFEDELGDPRMPERPVEFGKSNRYDMGLSGRIRMPNYGFTPSPAIFRKSRIDNSHSVRITFEPVDLYPEKSASLDTFFLVANADYAGKTLAGIWTAVAKDADDTQRGTLEVEVAPDVPRTDELLTKPARPDDDDDH